MEMCVDNPREGFADIFATHPSVDARVKALVEYAGGHDPGPLALEAPEQQAQLADQSGDEGPSGEPQQEARQEGPWGSEPGPAPTGSAGPWGPHRS